MKRIVLLVYLLGQVGWAEELKIQEERFHVSVELEGTFLVEKAEEVALFPQKWSKFKVLKVVKHGKKVAKGEVLIRFDSGELKQKIAKLENAAEAAENKVALAKLELAHLESSLALEQKLREQSKSRAVENLAYFQEVERASMRENAEFEVKTYENYLLYQKEELEQLTKMYEQDDLTEETEEIVLLRQKNDIEGAEFSLKQKKLSLAQMVKTVLIRKGEDLDYQVKKAKESVETHGELLPQKIEAKKIALKKLELEEEEQKGWLTEHKKDLGLMEIKAQKAGYVYYGKLTETEWKEQEMGKNLAAGLLAPLAKVLLSVVAPEDELYLGLAAPAREAWQLEEKQEMQMWSLAYPEKKFAGSLSSRTNIPDFKGRFPLKIKFSSKPKQRDLVAGMKGKARALVYKNESAILISERYLKEMAGGSNFLILKLANGKTEAREVKVGHRKGGMVEILEGLEPGQVVVDKERVVEGAVPSAEE